jgi:peptide/nickel transport system substrate-binding protein
MAVVLIALIAVGAGYYVNQQAGTTTTTAQTSVSISTSLGSAVPNPETLVEETAREAGPGGYDPASTWDAGGNIVFENVYETLVTFDGSHPDKFIPWLAESWEISPDGSVYTFHLRQGITFQDGTPFNATAVKFSIDRAILINHADGPQILIAAGETMAIKGGPRYFSAETSQNYNASEAKIYLAAGGVKAIDLYTVQITLEHPYAPAIATMAFSSAPSIVSPSYVIANCPGSAEMAGVIPGKECDFMRTHASGTGPFRLVEATPKVQTVLERYDGYWGGPNHSGPAKLERYIIKYVPEIGTRELDLYAGTADGIELPAANAFDIIDKDAWMNNHQVVSLRPGIRVWTAKTLRIQLFYINPRFSPFDNVLFRQALAYAFPYDRYIAQALNGFGTKLNGPIPEGMVGYSADLPGYTYSPDKARELFQKIGYKGKVTFTASTGDQAGLTATLMVQDSLRTIDPNLDVEINEVDFPTWVTLYHQFAVPIRIGGWLPDIADGSIFVANFATSGFGAQFTEAGKNTTIRDLANQAASSLDSATRTELYRQIQLELLNKVAYIPVCSLTAVFAERDWVLPSDSPIGRGLYNAEYGDGDGGVSGGYHAYNIQKAETTQQVNVDIGLPLLQDKPSYFIAVPRNIAVFSHPLFGLRTQS